MDTRLGWIRFLLYFLLLALCALAWHEAGAQVATMPLPNPKAQFLDNNGKPLAGGCLFTYNAGTTTQLATYSNAAGTIVNSNPVVLDAAGRADVWLGPYAYELALKSAGGINCASGVTQWTVDNVRGNIYVAGGVTGPGATVTLGTVTTLAPGASATVTNTGTPGAGVFNFGIPQGAAGGNLTIGGLSGTLGDWFAYGAGGWMRQAKPFADSRDYASFAAAIAAAGSGVLFVTPGTYPVPSNIVASANDLSIVCAPGAVLVDATTGTSGYAFIFSGARQKMVGCQFQGNPATQQHGLIYTSGTAGDTFRDLTITNGQYYVNTPANTHGYAAFQSENDTNLTLENVNCPTCFFQMWGGTSLGLSIMRSKLAGFFIQPIDATKPGPVSFDVSHNTFTPFGNGSTCGGGGDWTAGKTSPVINWTIADNRCVLTGSTALAPFFGGWSIVESNTSNGSFTGNKTYATGQYLTLGGLEFGGVNNVIANNEFYLPDSFSQSYACIESYASGNTFSNNKCQGWGKTGHGLLIYAEGGSGSGGNIIAINDFVQVGAGAQAAGIGVICNQAAGVGASSLDNVIAGNHITIGAAALTRAMDLQDMSGAAHTCPVGGSVDANTMNGSVYGVYSNAGTWAIGGNTFTSVTTPYNPLNGAALATKVQHSPLQLPLINLPHGSAPGSPNDGDCWTTTAGLFCRINGATVGPYAPPAAGGVVSTVTLTAQSAAIAVGGPAFYTASVAGQYMVYATTCVTAVGTSGSIATNVRGASAGFANIDSAGPTLSQTAVGCNSGAGTTAVMYLAAGGTLTYWQQTAMTGTGAYAIYITVTKLQ